MSIWQFAACVDGYNKANASEDARAEPLGVDEFDRLLELNADWIALSGASLH